MRVFDVESGEPDVYIRVNDSNRPIKAYAVQVSKRKFSVQLGKVEGLLRSIVLKFKRK
jgi:hypothetical protein